MRSRLKAQDHPVNIPRAVAQRVSQVACQVARGQARPGPQDALAAEDRKRVRQHDTAHMEMADIAVASLYET